MRLYFLELFSGSDSDFIQKRPAGKKKSSYSVKCMGTKDFYNYGKKEAGYIQYADAKKKSAFFKTSQTSFSQELGLFSSDIFSLGL